MKDDERIKAARQRMTEYAAEKLREEDQKRRRRDETAVKEEVAEPQAEAFKGSQKGGSSSSSSGIRKRERDPDDVLEKEDLLEEESCRGTKRTNDEEITAESSRRSIEMERGTKRVADSDGEQPEATRLRIQACEEDELHEPEWMWDEVDYDTNTGEALDSKLIQKGKEEEMQRFKEMGVYRYVTQENTDRSCRGRYCPRHAETERRRVV